MIDFDDVGNNDWLAVNQFTVVENKQGRRLDVVLFVNGLPLGVLELKNAIDENATVWTAFQQLQTYKAELSWAQLEAVVGADKRLKLVAQDIVAHFESRLEAMTGKAMVVCMSRRICVELYRELVRLRPIGTVRKMISAR